MVNCHLDRFAKTEPENFEEERVELLPMLMMTLNSNFFDRNLK